MSEVDKYERLLYAVRHFDWQQVYLNEAEPCFAIEENGTFCGRAERWAGHPSYHPFIAPRDAEQERKAK